MADIKLVITLPKELYESYKRRSPMLGDAGMDLIAQSIANGIPLPKGHGRLIDADELIKQLEVIANDEWNKQVGSSKGLEDAIDIVDDAPTIIGSDKEGE